MKSRPFTVVLMMFCINANAGWSNWATIDHIHLNDSPNRAYLKEMEITDPACTVDGRPTIMISGPEATDNGKELYSTALAAFMAGREVRVHAKNCWSEFSRPIVNVIEIR